MVVGSPMTPLGLQLELERRGWGGTVTYCKGGAVYPAPSLSAAALWISGLSPLQKGQGHGKEVQRVRRQGAETGVEAFHGSRVRRVCRRGFGAKAEVSGRQVPADADPSAADGPLAEHCGSALPNASQRCALKIC